ncbi:MAG: SDR family NAD(P)-dependent oxidoreductase, partial [Polyangiaceae bacterium]|nr:SDR family NAD(P)-dependent oxidoreductase [Polyangiaceae bacterium]
LSADLGDRDALEHLVDHARRELGPIDVLVNNVGVEQMGFYEDLGWADIDRAIALNLAAPMVLTRLVLPEMLARDRGHVLNVASIAGLGPTAFGETYGATKHGVVGFTRSLRASLKARASAVSASVICPGFVSDTGMYQAVHERYGIAAHWRLGTCTPSHVAGAAVRAIERDAPEVIVNRMPLRHLVALGAALPRAVELLTRAFDVNASSRELAEHRRAERGADAAVSIHS